MKKDVEEPPFAQLHLSHVMEINGESDVRLDYIHERNMIGDDDVRAIGKWFFNLNRGTNSRHKTNHPSPNPLEKHGFFEVLFVVHEVEEEWKKRHQCNETRCEEPSAPEHFKRPKEFGHAANVRA